MTGKDITSTTSASASSLELASRNTDLAVQRTCMSTDRTLMSIISASLAQVGFGFTIARVLLNFDESKVLEADGVAARCVGIALVLIGILLLIFGIPPGIHAFATPRADAIGRGWCRPWRKSLPNFTHAYHRRDLSRDQRCGGHKHAFPHRVVLMGAHTHFGMTRTMAICAFPTNACSTRWR